MTYSAVVTNNGTTHEQAYTSGDKIYIEEGSLEIDATARYLEYNSVSTHLDYSIYEDKALTFTVAEDPVYTITKDGLDAAQPIQIHVTLEGQELTEAQWEEMSLPTASVLDADGQSGYGAFRVEKSGTIGVYNLYPTLSGEELRPQVYEDCGYAVAYEGKHGAATWAGSAEGTLQVDDTRSWLERNLQRLIKGLIIAAIALLILGYIPPFKKRLPRKLKRRPSIDCSPNRPGIHQMTANGRYTKRFLTSLLPYKAEEGSIKFVPPGVAGVPVMQVKAAGGSGMLLMNAKAYAGKEHITFNGTPIEEGRVKPVRLSAGAMISVNTKEMTYTCVPNQ